MSDEEQRQQADAGSGVGVGGARAEGGLRPGSGLGLSQEVKSARGTGRRPWPLSEEMCEPITPLVEA